MSANGQPVGGCKGFLKILNTLVRKIKPDKVVVVWDGEGGSKKRKSINKNYKAGRSPPVPRAARVRLNRDVRTMTEEQEATNKLWQLSRVLEYLNCTPVIQLLEDGVEADDIIAAVVQHPSHEDWEKVIVSSDKDFFQLLDDKTLIYRPTQKEILNKKTLIKKYGVHPSNFALAKAMVGDTSDNLPGLMGVGMGTVAKRFPFLSEEKSYFLDDIVKDCLSQDAPLKVHHTVVENQSIVRENYKMMQLYVPSLSAQTHAKVRECMTEFHPEFNKSGLRTEMMKDGLGEVSLFDLFTTFNRIVSDSNK